MAQPNMDINKNPNATAPVMEFMLPASEVDADVSVGQLGKLVIPVEIVASSDGMITFRKNYAVEIEGNFRQETTAEMRKRLLAEQERDSKKTEKPKED